MQFTCPQCGHKLKAADNQAGQHARCTRCGTMIVIPAPPLPVAAMPLPTTPTPVEADDEPIRFPRPHHESGADIDLTPMIDVVFQLLIFFMVTAAFGLQKSLDLPPNKTSEESQASQTIEELEQNEDYVVVRIEQDNTIWVNDSEATSEPDLFAKLRQARQPSGGKQGPNRLLVVAHGGARHERVVMALDAGSTVGMESVKLATVDDGT